MWLGHHCALWLTTSCQFWVWIFGLLKCCSSYYQMLFPTASVVDQHQHLPILSLDFSSMTDVYCVLQQWEITWCDMIFSLSIVDVFLFVICWCFYCRLYFFLLQLLIHLVLSFVPKFTLQTGLLRILLTLFWQHYCLKCIYIEFSQFLWSPFQAKWLFGKNILLRESPCSSVCWLVVSWRLPHHDDDHHHPRYPS